MFSLREDIIWKVSSITLSRYEMAAKFLWWLTSYILFSLTLSTFIASRLKPTPLERSQPLALISNVCIFKGSPSWNRFSLLIFSLPTRSDAHFFPRSRQIPSFCLKIQWIFKRTTLYDQKWRLQVLCGVTFISTSYWTFLWVKTVVSNRKRTLRQIIFKRKNKCILRITRKLCKGFLSIAAVKFLTIFYG